MRKKLSKAMAQYIYYITDGEFVKIGRSNCPLKRLKQLQTSNPRTLKIVKTVLVSYYGHLAEASEKRLHKFYKKYRVRGEWFTDEVLNITKEPKTYLEEKHQFFKQGNNSKSYQSKNLEGLTRNFLKHAAHNKKLESMN